MPDEKLIDLELRYYDNEDYDEHFKDLLEAMNEGTLGDGGGESGGGVDPSEKIAWSDITGTPTTVDGYGITDAVKVGDKVAWSDVENAPTTLEGYGITDAVKASDTQQAITADTVTANAFTGALTGNAATATKLEAPVNVTFSGVTADATTFDGSADLNVNVTAVPAALVTGVLSEANIPASIVSTLKTVNTDEERFALTIDDVQNGDTVYVAEPAPGKMYRVIDDTKLNEEAGYQEFSAGIADKALADSEGNVITETYLKKTDAASTYAAKTELTSAVETLNTALEGKQAIGNYALKSDLSSYATTESVTSGLAAKADASALASYATTESLTEGLETKADAADLANYVSNDTFTTEMAKKANVSALSGYATTSALTDGLAAKADASALADYATTTALTEGLEAKANAADLANYATTQALTEGLAGKADTAALANYATTETVEAGLSAKADTSALADYVTDEELTAGLAEKANTSALAGYATTQSVEAVNSALEGKANTVHTHVAADITDMNTLLDSYVTTEQLSTQLAGKADTVHTHVTANITDFAEVMAGYVKTSSFEESLAAKADSTELSAYALKSELGDYATSESLTSGLAGKAAVVHTHTKSDITDFPADLVHTADLDAYALKSTTLAEYGIEDAYTKDETDAAIAEAKPILVNIPISGKGSILRNEPNQVYEASTVFGWFGVEDNEALKALIFSGRPMYVRQGLSIAGVPSYYMMPIVYIGYTSSNANKLEMSIIGNDTTDDKTIKYHVNINLDGTLLTDTSNVTVKKFYLDPKPAFAVGTEAPDDTDQLWLDSTTKAIKYYDTNTSAWVDFGTFSA